MKAFRFSIRATLLVVSMVAVDLAMLRYSLESIDDHRSPPAAWLNALPMANALAVVGLGLRRGASRERPFALGFFASGLAAMSIHLTFDLAFPQAKWRVYDGVGNAIIERVDLARMPDLVQFHTITGGYFLVYHSIFVVTSAPQFLVATLGGLAWRAIARRRLTTA